MALVYPMIVVILGFATLVSRCSIVIPKFKIIFDQLGATLPSPTRILINGSAWFVRYGWLVAIVLIVIGILVQRWIKTKPGRLWWDGFVLKVPLIRGLSPARFTQTSPEP